MKMIFELIMMIILMSMIVYAVDFSSDIVELDDDTVIYLGDRTFSCNTDGCTINGYLIINGNLSIVNATLVNITVQNYNVTGWIEADGFSGDGSGLYNIDADAIDDIWVNESGDTMTGNLVISNPNNLNISGGRLDIGLGGTFGYAQLYNYFGILTLDMTKGNGALPFLDIRPKHSLFGVTIRESDGTGSTVYSNIYVVDGLGASDYTMIGTNTGIDSTKGITIGNSAVGIGNAPDTSNIPLSITGHSQISLSGKHCFYLRDVDGTTNNKLFNICQLNKEMSIGISNDARTIDIDAINISRDGNTITQIIISSDMKLKGDNRKLFFGASNDSSIYYDGTNMIFNSNKTGTGIAYFTSNISAQNVIDRSWYWDKSLGNAVDYVLDSDNISDDSDLFDFEKITYEVTDFDNPITVQKSRYGCINVTNLYETYIDGMMVYEKNYTLECSTEYYDEITYPYKKNETGRLISAVIGKHEQVLREQLDAGMPKQVQNISTPSLIVNSLIADEIYTQSKTIEDGVDYIEQIKDKDKLKNKTMHPAFLYTIDEIGEEYELLSMEDRIVILEGSINQLFNILCDKNILKKDDGCIE